MPQLILQLATNLPPELQTRSARALRLACLHALDERLVDLQALLAGSSRAHFHREMEVLQDRYTPTGYQQHGNVSLPRLRDALEFLSEHIGADAIAAMDPGHPTMATLRQINKLLSALENHHLIVRYGAETTEIARPVAAAPANFVTAVEGLWVLTKPRHNETALTSTFQVRYFGGLREETLPFTDDLTSGGNATLRFPNAETMEALLGARHMIRAPYLIVRGQGSLLRKTYRFESPLIDYAWCRLVNRRQDALPFPEELRQAD